MIKTITIVLTEAQAARLATGLGELRVVDLRTEAKLIHRFHQALRLFVERLEHMQRLEPCPKRHDQRLADRGTDLEELRLDLTEVLPK